MFSLREFLKKGFLKAVGSMPTYKIILNATGWYDKEILTLEDLEEISKAIEEYELSLIVVEEPVFEEPTEEVEQEVTDEPTEEVEQEVTDEPTEETTIEE